jgi:hypothetical protein
VFSVCEVFEVLIEIKMLIWDKEIGAKLLTTKRVMCLGKVDRLN